MSKVIKVAQLKELIAAEVTKQLSIRKQAAFIQGFKVNGFTFKYDSQEEKYLITAFPGPKIPGYNPLKRGYIPIGGIDTEGVSMDDSPDDNYCSLYSDILELASDETDETGVLKAFGGRKKLIDTLEKLAKSVGKKFNCKVHTPLWY